MTRDFEQKKRMLESGFDAVQSTINQCQQRLVLSNSSFNFSYITYCTAQCTILSTDYCHYIMYIRWIQSLCKLPCTEDINLNARKYGSVVLQQLSSYSSNYPLRHACMLLRHKCWSKNEKYQKSRDFFILVPKFLSSLGSS